jgi:hypothetical protein
MAVLKGWPWRRIVSFVILLVVGFAFQGFQVVQPTRGSVAVGIFLSPDDDVSYLGARTILYQLLHAPETQLPDGIPVVVLVTPEVEGHKRHRLQADGATVVPVDHIKTQIPITVPHWVNTMTKLRLFDPEVLPYEKVLLIDTSMALLRPIDALFHDSGMQPTRPRNESGQMLEDVGPFPERFLLAVLPGSTEGSRSRPLTDGHRSRRFDSRFLLYSPSQDLFNYYRRLFEIPDSLEDLLNYVHREDGPLPPQTLHVAEQLFVEGELRRSDLSLPPDHAFNHAKTRERRISCKARAWI